MNDFNIRSEDILFNKKIKGDLITIKGVFKQQWLIAKSYLANTIMLVVVPIVLAALPILLFGALNTDSAVITKTFFGGNESGNINAYIIFGTNLWMTILMILWDFSTFLRNEQLTGTLESILMSPAKRHTLLLGRAAFSILFNVIIMIGALVISLLIFDRNLLFSTEFLRLLLVVLLILIGCLPMIGLSYTIGALVLKFKEVYTLINLLQWFFAVIMGIYSPWTTLPLSLKIFSVIFPGTWTVSDVRGIIAGSPPMLTLIATWLGLQNVSMPILWSQIIVVLFTLVWGIGGYLLFAKIERRIKQEEGLSTY